jgi:hypothetical protein
MKVDEPDLVAHLPHAHVLAGEDGAEVDLEPIHAALGAAPLPVLDQVAEELAAPADAAFEESEAQIRETPLDRKLLRELVRCDRSA